MLTIDRITVLALAPVLLAQGLRVRRATPRLPEPPGERNGTAGSGPSLRLLIAGDSAAAGVGAPDQVSALSGQLLANLTPRFRVAWRLVARTGNRIRDVIDQLEGDPRDTFDVAVISIGVNDVTGGTSTTRWLALQQQLAQLLASRFGVRRTLLCAIPPMQAFPALPNPLAWYLGRRAAQLNRASNEWARQDRRCEFVESALPLEKNLIAPDGFHPGPAAYRAWGRHLAERILDNFPA